jgi:hypothetical protein
MIIFKGNVLGSINKIDCFYILITTNYQKVLNYYIFNIPKSNQKKLTYVQQSNNKTLTG